MEQWSAQAPDPSASPSASALPLEQSAPGRGRILIVDDEAPVRQAIVDSLRHDGYEVWEASDGPSALECLARQPFALVITDIVMPQMDGLSFIKTAGQRGYRTSHGNIVMLALARLATCFFGAGSEDGNIIQIQTLNEVL